MTVQYYKEWSSYLRRDMEYKVYGESGRVLLAFPPEGGRFYDWEDHGMVRQAARWIDAGKLQLVCADPVDRESWSARNLPLRARTEMQEKWFCYLTAELYPRMQALTGTEKPVCTAGVGLGAAHAVNLFLRRPALFGGVIALSGVYDSAAAFGADAGSDDLLYRNDPAAYLSDMAAQDPRLAQYAAADPLVLCAGQGAGEEAASASAQALALQLQKKGVSAHADLWGMDVTPDWSWWQKELDLFLTRWLG